MYNSTMSQSCSSENSFIPIYQLQCLHIIAQLREHKIKNKHTMFFIHLYVHNEDIYENMMCSHLYILFFNILSSIKVNPIQICRYKI